MKLIETCATCRHLKIVEEGFEVEGLLDTAYLKSRCEVLGWEVKEHYLLPDPQQKEIRGAQECPYWEYWDKVERLRESG